MFKNSTPDLFFKSTHCPVFGTGLRILIRNGLYASSVCFSAPQKKLSVLPSLNFWKNTAGTYSDSSWRIFFVLEMLWHCSDVGVGYLYIDLLVDSIFGWLVNIGFVERLHDAFQNWRVNPGYLLELQVSAVSGQDWVGALYRQPDSYASYTFQLLWGMYMEKMSR